MSRLRRLLSTSIGKKQLVALTGLLLCGFLVTHLAGNLVMLKSSEEFEHYAEFLAKHPLLIPAEIMLAALFLAHIAWGLKVSWENRNARPERYDGYRSLGGRSLGSSTMKYTGLMTLVFLLVHVTTFKLQFPGDSLFAWIMEWFQKPLYAGFYVLAMLFLGVHLSHGVQSAFQTFGVNHPKYTPAIRATSVLFAVMMAAGFGILPIWGYMKRCG
jgi:succinate dehydrogenase / fumarate reductase, cytochrome b subunit